MQFSKLFEPGVGALNSIFAPHYLPASDLFLTKQGSLGAVYKLRGVDFECQADEMLESVTHGLHTAIRNLDPDIRVYQYLLKRKGVSLAYHRADKLYTIELYWVFLYEPKSARRGLISTKRLSVSGSALHAQSEQFNTGLAAFETAAAETLGLQRQDQHEIFGFLQRLTNLAEAEPKPLRYSDHLDFWMGQHAISVHGKHVSIRRPIVPLTLRELPKRTCPNLLHRLLALECDFILCSEFKRIPGDGAAKKIMDRQDHFDFTKRFRNKKSALKQATTKGRGEVVTDGSATKNISDLDQALIRINNGGEFVGAYSLTLILHGEDRAALNRPAAQAINILGNVEGRFAIETIGALDAYLSIIPGNTENNNRRQWIPSMNYADLALVYAPAVGERTNRHLNKESLLILETTYKTPYFFNLHEADLLGVLMVGVMGSGKSYFSNYCLDASQKYHPFTFIFDIGGSYRFLTKKHGGSYLHMSLTQEDVSINPFAAKRTAHVNQFLFSFVKVLLAHSGCQTTAKDDRAIFNAVKIAPRLSKLELPEHLMEYLFAWIGDGQYAALFDNEHDTLDLARFQTFDFQGMEIYPQLVEPLLFYLFQRIFQVVYDPKNRAYLKQIWADEVWRFIKNPTAQQHLISAGLTGRKHNLGIGLITQSPQSLKEAGMRELVNQICSTKVLFANPGADFEEYRRDYHLNDREVDLVSHLIPKQQIFVKTATRSALLNVHADALASWQYRNDPNSNEARDAAIALHGDEEGLKQLAKGA